MEIIYNQEEEGKLSENRYSLRAGIFGMLLEMGYPMNFINSAINYTQSLEIDNLITFMTKGERGWEHEFLSKNYIADEQNICKICGDVDTEHLEALVIEYEDRDFIKDNFRTIQSRYSQRFDQDYIEVNELNCGICFETNEFLWSLPCCQIHFFCQNCIKQYLETKISNSKVLKISCPGEKCPGLFSYEDISPFLSSEYIAKYEKFGKKQQLISDPSIKFCIVPDCEGIIKGSREFPHIKCPECNYDMCFLCGKAWHELKTCDDIQKLEYEIWAQDKDVKDCPNCKYKIEKNKGCDHMTCVICNYEFCWICLDVWHDNHFEDGCRAVQVPAEDHIILQELDANSNSDLDDINYDNHDPSIESFLTKKVIILTIIFLPLTLPLFLVFGPAVLITYVLLENSYYGTCKKWAIGTTTAIVIFILTPLIDALVILSLPCTIPFMIKEYRN